MTNIDLEFKKYVDNYDMSNKKIKLKYNHSYRVKQKSIELAKSLNLDEENIFLASIIGLLHDIGRFEQVKIYDSFSDSKTIDHADLGVKILFEDGLIKNFIQDDKYNNIIYKAIKNHNKLEIEEGLDDITLLHSKIIRDTDKLDILYINVFTDENLYDDDGSEISEDVKDDFFLNQPVKNSNAKTNSDNIIRMLSFMYDINFKYSYKYIIEHKYIETMYENLINKEMFKDYFEHILEYVKERY